MPIARENSNNVNVESNLASSSSNHAFVDIDGDDGKLTVQQELLQQLAQRAPPSMINHHSSQQRQSQLPLPNNVTATPSGLPCSPLLSNISDSFASPVTHFVSNPVIDWKVVEPLIRRNILAKTQPTSGGTEGNNNSTASAMLFPSKPDVIMNKPADLTKRKRVNNSESSAASTNNASLGASSSAAATLEPPPAGRLGSSSSSNVPQEPNSLASSSCIFSDPVDIARYLSVQSSFSHRLSDVKAAPAAALASAISTSMSTQSIAASLSACDLLNSVAALATTAAFVMNNICQQQQQQKLLQQPALLINQFFGQQQQNLSNIATPMTSCEVNKQPAEIRPVQAHQNSNNKPVFATPPAAHQNPRQQNCRDALYNLVKLPPSVPAGLSNTLAAAYMSQAANNKLPTAVPSSSHQDEQQFERTKRKYTKRTTAEMTLSSENAAALRVKRKYTRRKAIGFYLPPPSPPPQTDPDLVSGGSMEEKERNYDPQPQEEAKKTKITSSLPPLKLPESSTFLLQLNLDQIEAEARGLDALQTLADGQQLVLWQFLLHLLLNSCNQDIIHWTNYDHWDFKITDVNKVAAKWGEHKKCPAMNYEKMARGLRYYYPKGTLKKAGKRYVYQFNDGTMRKALSDDYQAPRDLFKTIGITPRPIHATPSSRKRPTLYDCITTEMASSSSAVLPPEKGQLEGSEEHESHLISDEVVSTDNTNISITNSQEPVL